jgi:hypothetical protein
MADRITSHAVIPAQAGTQPPRTTVILEISRSLSSRNFAKRNIRDPGPQAKRGVSRPWVPALPVMPKACFTQNSGMTGCASHKSRAPLSSSGQPCNASPVPRVVNGALQKEMAMAFEDKEAEIGLLLTRMQNEPENRHELYQLIVQQLNELKAYGMPLPEDLVRLEKGLEAEFAEDNKNAAP